MSMPITHSELLREEVYLARETAILVLCPSRAGKVASQWDAIAAQRVRLRPLRRKPQVADRFPIRGEVCR